MSQKSFHINGQVLDQQTRTGIKGLRIEAWDKDLIFDDLVGSAITDEQGAFHIEFYESYFAEIFLDRRPDIFFRVYFNETLVYDTKNHILWNLEEHDKKLDILLDGSLIGLPDESDTPPIIPGVKLDQLADLIGLDGEAIQKLKEKDLVLEQVGETSLAAMVDENIITPAQKKDIQLSVGLALLSGENLELTKALKTVTQDSPVELARWNKADWQAFLSEKNIRLPADETDVESYAENLRDTVEQSFPSAYFLHRVINGGAGEKISELLNSIAPLFKYNKTVIPTTPDETVDHDWQGIGANSKETIQAGLAALSPLLNSYRALGLAEILNHPEQSAEQKQSAIERRFASLSHFYGNNPGINLQYADFASSNAATKRDLWNWQGIEQPERNFIKKQMAATQRSFIIGKNHETGELLMKKGYDSAHAITSKTEADFLASSGLGWEKGKKVYAKANEMAATAAHYFEAIRDAASGSFRHIAANNQQDSLVNDLKEIDGYEELFGNQNYCDCEACKSIFSPAAYFTDLMYFVNNNVSKRLFIPSLTQHPLYLKRRRPDLWTLKLSCQNTNTEIPYLQVVNEVLEQYLAQEVAGNVYAMLGSADWSCRQPFNLALEETRLFLSHFGLSLAEIYQTLQLPEHEQRREQLLLSVEELAIIATANPGGARKRFGNIPPATLTVQEFIRLAGISRAQLDDLLSSQFAPTIAAVNVQTSKSGVDIQLYYEKLVGLNDNTLDVIHRYLRLWKKTAWSLREFDLILYAMREQGLLTTLEDKDGDGVPKLLQLAQVKSIQDRLGCSPEDMAALIFRMPLTAISDNQLPLYRRIFDLEKIFQAPADEQSTITLALDQAAPLILAGLGITQPELDMLCKLLGVDTGIGLTINIGLLSALYRHAVIAHGLKLNIEDFVNLLNLIPGGAITQLAQVERLADAASWRKESPFSISELRLIINGEESSDLHFANDILAVAAAVKEIQATATANNKNKADLLKAYLQRSFNLTGDQLDADFFNQLLSLGLNSPAIVAALNAHFSEDLPGNPGNLKALPDNPDDLDGLVTLIHELERFSLLFSKAQFDAEMISFMVGHKDVFGIADLQSPNLDYLANMLRYHALLDRKDEQREALNLALQNIQEKGVFTDDENATFANVWAQPKSLIASLTGSSNIGKSALDRVAYLQNCLEHSITLGLQGDALLKLQASDQDGLLAARNVVVGAFASKYADEKTRNEKLEPYNDKLNTLKRDALCDYIISRSDIFKFKDRSDLFNFFLLDVEMSGCFRTSYLVAAITSLQLYIHRCLMNLEQSDELLNPNIANVRVTPDWIPAEEWEWRKNYRVWEANRKVFLYPENYIDPTLRDGKTEIFKELEDELLQQKITQESAEAAYKKYLAQFSELTRLRYAGGYYQHISDGSGFLGLGAARALQDASQSFYYIGAISFEQESDESRFYLFARTHVHPYQYYYRTYNHYKKVWTSWKTIDLGIEAAEISTLIYQGKLYIFWTEVQSKEVSKIKDGNSISDGFVFKAYVKYAFLDENGKWSAPQRLYIGQNHVSEELVFRRVWDGNYPDDAKREKTHDSTVEKFQQLVFRKPYAYVVDDNKQPIALQHIWSHNKEIDSKVTYSTGNISIEYYGIELDVPSQTFTVTNDNFNLAVKEVNATITYTGLFQFKTKAEVRLLDSGHCRVKFKEYGLSFEVYASFQHNNLSTPIKTSVTQISLSRNTVTNLKQDDMLGNATNLSSASALWPEYVSAFAEKHSVLYHIENGTKSLCKHAVWQTPQNDALLYIIDNGHFESVALSTILTDELGDILFAKGLERFLAPTTQKLTDDDGQHLDFNGAYGDYYWEMFFHIPFLIADHLNANQKFKEAKWWYERIFNPTAEEKPNDSNKTEHNWQFREFGNLNIQKLKDILTDEKAIAAYKNDPFNPHAIARLRLSAYQKTIVMHYIDNLLDWGDRLFTQDTRESINEAEMLYQLAADILGKRPIKVGKCETVNEDSLTYANIELQLDKANSSEFLIQLENYSWQQKQTYAYEKQLARTSKRLDSISGKQSERQRSFAEIEQKAAFTSVDTVIQKIRSAATTPSPANLNQPAARSAANVKSYKKTKAQRIEAQENISRWQDSAQYIFGEQSNDRFRTKPNPRLPCYELVKQSTLVFCVPPNTDLMQYWDRVEDRLFKIRNCMNIKGMRRSLSLFQPPIDPMLLVRARAAGLSLEDISELVNGPNLPAYRFTYLVEKAKQFTQTVQSFGSALLSALEKKDGEELTLLRTVHEKNILKLTKNIKRKQLQDAQHQYKASEAALTNVQNRVDYYQELIDTGLISWEVTEQVSKWTASSIKITEATLEFLTSTFGFMPQVGSPFAMKYGGHELHNGMQSLAAATGTLATVADNIAILAGLEASHQRREQDWKQQLKLAQQELKQSGIQLLAAEIRQQIAEQDLLIHDKNIEQADELFDFYKNKFTKLGLYNYMASSLNRLYRDAYNIAYNLAKQAESAYQHERFDDEFYIQADNWQFDRAGLLAGERLLLQLQELEKKFIDSNVRQPEITQTFSLAMLSPSELLNLRQNGDCTINIPEIAFEMLYPGQYRRTIKSVRITIPCVAGPYANVSAKLTLTGAIIKMKDELTSLNPSNLDPLSIAVGASICSSSANNDSGVFDLNFRDERYLPFEGAGAISDWELKLPKTFRAFNYDTISDVLLHISYTAVEGNRAAAEANLALLISDHASKSGFYRLVSLRHEFPDMLHKLLNQDHQTVSFELTPAHFPYALSSKKLEIVSGCMVYLKPKKEMTAQVSGTVKLNTVAIDWTDEKNNIPQGAISGLKDDRIKGGTVMLTGSPIKTWTLDTGNGTISKNTTEDLLILIKYKTT